MNQALFPGSTYLFNECARILAFVEREVRALQDPAAADIWPLLKSLIYCHLSIAYKPGVPCFAECNPFDGEDGQPSAMLQEMLTQLFAMNSSQNRTLVNSPLSSNPQASTGHRVNYVDIVSDHFESYSNREITNLDKDKMPLWLKQAALHYENQGFIIRLRRMDLKQSYTSLIQLDYIHISRAEAQSSISKAKYTYQFMLKLNGILSRSLGIKINFDNLARNFLVPIHAHATLNNNFFRKQQQIPALVVYDNLFSLESLGLLIGARSFGIKTTEAVHGSGFIPYYYYSIDMSEASALLPDYILHMEPISIKNIIDESSRSFLGFHRQILNQSSRNILDKGQSIMHRKTTRHPRILIIDSPGDPWITRSERERCNLIRGTSASLRERDISVSWVIRPHPVWGMSSAGKYLKEIDDENLIEIGKICILEDDLSQASHAILLTKSTAWKDVLHSDAILIFTEESKLAVACLDLFKHKTKIASSVKIMSEIIEMQTF